jgi:RNA polymerase sigma-70 factor, ECF subfamily
MIQRFHSGESDLLPEPVPEPVSELESLIEASAAGNRAAFSALYDAAAPQLFGLALRILKRRDWAEDVLQEALISAWRNAGEYRRELGSGKAWLTVILRNRALDRLRREATARLEPSGDAMPEVEDPSPSALDLTISGESGRRLMACLEQLEEVQKRAILMAYFEGLTHEELAARIASPLGTVKSWIRRGLQRLKGCLEP